MKRERKNEKRLHFLLFVTFEMTKRLKNNNTDSSSDEGKINFRFR